ncbi:MAG: protein kinase [Bryobacteraceae bacterium]|nr:protein kinase [Bryobacteraceae bacterium]
MTGSGIGQYRVISKLGEGAMGKVYRALDTMVEREVALKALRPEIAAQPETLDRFRKEAVTLGRLNHVNIAQLYTFVKEGADFYMVMEFVDGETLESIISRRGALPWQEAAKVLLGVLDGIQHAHSLGILHRDLKPANIMLSRSGQVKVMDFGIAQALGAAKMTRDGRVVGTLEYLAPERIQGKPADARSDVYSTGIVLYEMLTGRLPFQSQTEYELLVAHVQTPPPPPRSLGVGLPADVEEVLLRALEKDPDWRYASAAEFAGALRRLLGAPASEVKETRFLPVEPASRLSAAAWLANAEAVVDTRLPASLRGKRVAPIAATAVAMLAIVALAVAVLGGGKKPSAQPSVAAVNTPAPQMMPEPAPAAPTPAPVEPTPAPVTTAEPPPQEIAPPVFLPVQPPAQSKPAAPAPSKPKPFPTTTARAPEPSPEVRRAALAALDRTEPGAPAGAPGVRPIHLTGLAAALRLGAPALLPDISEAVARRGVAFMMAPPVEQTLQSAGASPELLKIVAASYHAPEPAVIPAAPAPKPVPPTEPARRAIATLADVREVFVEKMPGGLDEFMREEIGKQLGGRLKVVSSPAAADARLELTVEEGKGGKLSSAGRMFGIKERQQVQARLLDRETGRVLWQDKAGDRKFVVGRSEEGAQKKLASRLIKELKEDLGSR